MKILLLLPVAVLSLFAAEVRSAVRPWPGSGNCAGTFYACVNSAAAGDVIEITTATPIDEPDESISKVLSVRAAPGIKATFAAERSLYFYLDSPTPFDVQFEGLRFLDGSLSVTAVTAGVVHVRDNDIRNLTDVSGIFLIGMGFDRPDFTLETRVERNRLRVARATGNGMRLVASGPDAFLNARVTDNHITAEGDTFENLDGFGRQGIAVQADGNTLPNHVLIERNRILPDPERNTLAARFFLGISLGTNGDGQVRARIANNLSVIKPDGNFLASNLWVQPNLKADFDLTIVNNTLIGGRNGVRIGSSSPEPHAFSGILANNVIADNPLFGVLIRPTAPEGALANRNNVVFQAGQNDFVPGPNTLTSDPGLMGPLHRPTANSIVREAGDSASFFTAGPGALGTPVALDVDGLRRVRLNQIDIGAIEYGDWTTAIDVLESTSQRSLFDVAGLLPDPTEIQITRSDGLRQDGIVLNPLPIATGQVAPGFAPFLFAQNGALLPTGAGFSLFVATTGNGAGTHVTNSGNSFGATGSTLGAPWSSMPADRIFLVSPGLNETTPVRTDTRPVGAQYSGGQWRLRTTDNGTMPLGLRYTVLAQPPSRNAFVHTATAANQPTNLVTLLDHPDLNGFPCASPQVSVNANGTLPVPYVSARYEATLARWFIQSEAIGVPIPNGARFFVLVDPRTIDEACRGTLLIDGFE